MLEKVVVISLLAATLIICLEKWGLFSKYRNWSRRPEWLPKDVCYFCFGFWLAVGLYFLFPAIPEAVLVPLVCASLISLVLNLST